MLDIKEIIYPITFISDGFGEFTFTSKTECTNPYGEKRGPSIEYFISQHNIWNPDNEEKKDYYFHNVKSGKKCEFDSRGWNVGDMAMRIAATVTASGTCKVEQMPLGAKLIGILKESGEWVDLSVKPVRIEVDCNAIAFLMHQAPCKDGLYGEVRVNKGTVIKWSE